jgi:hypothetical protein
MFRAPVTTGVASSLDERLVWYTEIAARATKKIAVIGIFDNWHGFLVRDDGVGAIHAALAGQPGYPHPRRSDIRKHA